MAPVPSVTRTQAQCHSPVSPTPTVLPETFPISLAHACIPLVSARLSGPDHITVRAAMIAALSDRWMWFCHSPQSSLAPRSEARETRWEARLNGQGSPIAPRDCERRRWWSCWGGCVFSGCPAVKEALQTAFWLCETYCSS